MMTPIHTAWDRGPWTRHETEPPHFPTRVARELSEQIEDLPDDTPVTITADLLRELIAAATPPEGGKPGAQIHDHDRNVTYRGTVNERNELDYLAVEIHGYIGENALRRVPVERLRREVFAQVAADAKARAEEGHDDVFTVVLPGGLSERPSLEDVARLISEGRDRLWFHTAYADVPKRTVDGWMRRARKQYPEITGGKSSPVQPNK